jgi:hypothetical protein
VRYLILATVAFIAGGNGRADVEVYNPDGGCPQFLGYVPFSNLAPILGMVNGKITFCAWYSDKRCSQYDASTNTWTPYTTMNYLHYGASGIFPKQNN